MPSQEHARATEAAPLAETREKASGIARLTGAAPVLATTAAMTKTARPWFPIGVLALIAAALAIG
ncbi:hypothetical protein ABI023_14865, partial [Enterococcus faecium]|uniref:hypothetical protein n=1 Tax=Enterococcus faecium TaxID=1352 RepID=UPI003F42018D